MYTWLRYAPPAIHDHPELIGGTITGGRPDHLDDYKADLLARGNTAKYADETIAQIKRVIEMADATRISDLTPTRVQQAIASMRSDQRGGSIRSCNKHLVAIKGFSKWLHRNRLVRDDTLVTLKADNADKDPRHQRRDISDEELHRLFESTKGHDIGGGMTGADRVALYWLAAGTGFRRNELRSLTPASFDLDAQPPTVTVQANVTKAGRTRSTDPRGSGSSPAAVAGNQARQRTRIREHASERRPDAALGSATSGYRLQRRRESV